MVHLVQPPLQAVDEGLPFLFRYIPISIRIKLTNVIMELPGDSLRIGRQNPLHVT